LDKISEHLSEIDFAKLNGTLAFVL